MKLYHIKYIALSAVFFLATGVLSAQTGIGTTDPQAPLHIVDDGFPQLTIASASGVDSATLGMDSTGLTITTAGQNQGNIILKPKGAVGIGTLPEKLFSIGNDTDRFSFSVSGKKLQVWNDANPPVMVFEFDSSGTNGFTALRNQSSSDMDISLNSGSSNEFMLFRTQDSSGNLLDRIRIENFINTSTIDIVNADLDVDNGVYYVDTDDDNVGIGTKNPEAILDMSNAKEPLVVPRLSTTQIIFHTTFTNPKKGEILFDALLNHLYVYNGLVWKKLD